jgi:GNAT superfamily N-acetyltransferase
LNQNPFFEMASRQPWSKVEMTGTAFITGLEIKAAVAADAEVLLAFIRDLAEYEQLSHEVTATADDLAANLFGPRPPAEALIGRFEGRPVGFALFFHTFSTFLGRPGIYVEDLFVRPESRGRGFGKALLAAVARIARQRRCGRLEWSVLDWNTPAIRFYRSIGAKSMQEWHLYRLTGTALRDLADASPPSRSPQTAGPL